jgi:hypothetical protein
MMDADAHEAGRLAVAITVLPGQALLLIIGGPLR